MELTGRNRGVATANRAPIYLLPEKKLCGLSPNFHIHVSLSDLYIPAIGSPIFLQQNFRYIVFAVWLKSKEWAPAKLSRESQPMIYREGSIVYRKNCTLWSPF